MRVHPEALQLVQDWEESWIHQVQRDLERSSQYSHGVDEAEQSAAPE